MKAVLYRTSAKHQLAAMELELKRRWDEKVRLGIAKAPEPGFLEIPPGYTSLF